MHLDYEQTVALQCGTPFRLLQLLHWVCLCGGLRAVTIADGWPTIASQFRMGPRDAHHIVFTYISRLLHLEEDLRVRGSRITVKTLLGISQVGFDDIGLAEAMSASSVQLQLLYGLNAAARMEGLQLAYSKHQQKLSCCVFQSSAGCKVTLYMIMAWVVLLGGCQVVSDRHGWHLVAINLGLEEWQVADLKQLYDSQLLQIERQVL